MNSVLNDFTVPVDGKEIRTIDIKSYESLRSSGAIEECLKACPNVSRLTISLSKPPEGILFDFKELLFKIGQYGKAIEVISLSGEFLFDKDLSIISQDNFPLLKGINLRRCHNITHLGIQSLVSQCPHLINLGLLEISFKQWDQVAFYIGKFLPKLKKLIIYSRGPRLTDSGIIAIANGCRKLEHIQLARNYSLTDQSLEKIGAYCKALIAIDMNHNDKITEKGLMYLIDSCPNFKYFNHGGFKKLQNKYLKIKFSHPEQSIPGIRNYQ